MTPKLTDFVKVVIDEERKKAELKIAAFIAEHCSINAVDHLGEVIPNLDNNSEALQKIKLHRTKCTGNCCYDMYVMCMFYWVVRII